MTVKLNIILNARFYYNSLFFFNGKQLFFLNFLTILCVSVCLMQACFQELIQSLLLFSCMCRCAFVGLCVCVCVCCSVEDDVPGSKVSPSMDPSGGHSCSPVIHGDAFCPSQLYAHLFLPGHQQPCKAKLQHSQSLLCKRTEKEAFKDLCLLSENYEPSNIQHKQVREVWTQTSDC